MTARDSAELIKLVTLPVYCDRLMGHSSWLVLLTWAFHLNRGFATLDNFCKNFFLRVWNSRQIRPNTPNWPVTHGCTTTTSVVKNNNSIFKLNFNFFFYFRETHVNKALLILLKSISKSHCNMKPLHRTGFSGRDNELLKNETSLIWLQQRLYHQFFADINKNLHL